MSQYRVQMHITRRNFGPTLTLVSTSLQVLVGPSWPIAPPGGRSTPMVTREPICTRHMDGTDLYIEQWSELFVVWILSRLYRQGSLGRVRLCVCVFWFIWVCGKDVGSTCGRSAS